jgi:hypothetical protein
MYFTTFNHSDEIDEFNENENENKNKNDLCLICWDPSITNNNLIKMKSTLSYLLFYKDCSCNGIFHYNCLLKWINVTKSCPICRKPIVNENDINNENVVPLNNKSQIFRFINFTNNNAYKIFKYMFLFILLKTMYDIAFDVQHTIENHSDITQDECLLN